LSQVYLTAYRKLYHDILRLSQDVFVLQFYAKDVNGTLTTLETRDPRMTRVIGQRQELSFYDVKLANKAYCDSQ